MLKPRLWGVLIGLLLALPAVASTDWQATYSVRQGSIEGGQAVQRYTAADGRYRLTLDVTPGGVVALFTQETFQDESSGVVDDGGWRPQQYLHVREGDASSATTSTASTGRPGASPRSTATGRRRCCSRVRSTS